MPQEDTNFDGLNVAAFERRRAEETSRMIEKAGGTAFVSPSMREIPTDSNVDAINMANHLSLLVPAAFERTKGVNNMAIQSNSFVHNLPFFRNQQHACKRRCKSRLNAVCSFLKCLNMLHIQ